MNNLQYFVSFIPQELYLEIHLSAIQGVSDGLRESTTMK